MSVSESFYHALSYMLLKDDASGLERRLSQDMSGGSANAAEMVLAWLVYLLGPLLITWVIFSLVAVMLIDNFRWGAASGAQIAWDAQIALGQ